jgi:hypothetical protein
MNNPTPAEQLASAEMASAGRSDIFPPASPSLLLCLHEIVFGSSRRWRERSATKDWMNVHEYLPAEQLVPV